MSIDEDELIGERLAGDGADGVVLEPREAAQVDGETINRLARDFGAVGFFQAAKEIIETRCCCKSWRQRGSDLI